MSAAAQAPTLLPSGRLCAWCYPGRQHGPGHGICADHMAKELAAAGLKPPLSVPDLAEASAGSAVPISQRESTP